MVQMIDLMDRMMSSATERQLTWAGHYSKLCEQILPLLELEDEFRTSTLETDA